MSATKNNYWTPKAVPPSLWTVEERRFHKEMLTKGFQVEVMQSGSKPKYWRVIYSGREIMPAADEAQVRAFLIGLNFAASQR